MAKNERKLEIGKIIKNAVRRKEAEKGPHVVGGAGPGTTCQLQVLAAYRLLTGGFRSTIRQDLSCFRVRAENLLGLFSADGMRSCRSNGIPHFYEFFTENLAKVSNKCIFVLTVLL